MDPRRPPVTSPATHARSHSSGVSSPADTDYDYESEYNEKDAYARKDSARTDGTNSSHYAIKQPAYTNAHTPTHARAHAHAHDSVLSPFSPKASAPPSPSSSICSDAAGRKQRAVADIQEDGYARRSHQSQHISPPARAHLDPEKASAHDAAYEHRASANDVAAVVYDKTEYHEKGPEDKAWQLLVRFLLSITPHYYHHHPHHSNLNNHCHHTPLTPHSSTSPAPAPSSPSP